MPQLPKSTDGTLNVRHFGAVGDGRTDDAPAIQTALDQTDGGLFFPGGDYLLRSGLRLDMSARGRTHICGAGARLLNASDGPALHIMGTHEGTSSPSSVTERTWARELMPVIRDIEIAGVGDCGDGIVLEGTFKAVVSGVIIHGCRNGIRLVRRNRDIIISDSHLYRNRQVGVLYDHVSLHQSIIVGCHISHNGLSGVKIDGGDIRNVQITGNDIEYNYTEGVGVCADVWFVVGPPPGTGIREATISGNTIQAMRTEGGANIRIEGRVDEQSQKAGLIAISGNMITSQDYNIWAQNARAVTISANTFLLGSARNLWLGDCRHISVTGNVIDDIPDYGGQTCGGIELIGCTGCHIGGTIVGGATPGHEQAAIALQQCQTCSVNGCQVLGQPLAAVELRDCVACRVSDCLLQRPQGDDCEPLPVHGGSGNSVCGNQVVP
jgi:hypothetical protein